MSTRKPFDILSIVTGARPGYLTLDPTTGEVLLFRVQKIRFSLFELKDISEGRMTVQDVSNKISREIDSWARELKNSLSPKPNGAN